MTAKQRQLSALDHDKLDQDKALRILLVEDHADTAAAMSRLLKRGGYGVQIARTVAAARECTRDTSFDLLICDIGLPDGSGLELMSELKQRLGIKGICLSGYDFDQDAQVAKAAGFSARLTKPVDMQKLEALIKQIVPARAS
jgi:CheY-like chemotaxis protein